MRNFDLEKSVKMYGFDSMAVWDSKGVPLMNLYAEIATAYECEVMTFVQSVFMKTLNVCEQRTFLSKSFRCDPGIEMSNEKTLVV